MDASTLVAFAAAFFVFAASPGPDNMTIVARTVSHGAASGIAYGLGTTVGVLVFLALAAFGLSVLAAEMGTLMAVLRYLGAGYLVWMGYRLWTTVPVVPGHQPTSARRSLLTVFATGVALNLGNPKMPLFYVALLPNVIGASLTLGHLGDVERRDLGGRGGRCGRTRAPGDSGPQPPADAARGPPGQSCRRRRDDRSRGRGAGGAMRAFKRRSRSQRLSYCCRSGRPPLAPLTLAAAAFAADLACPARRAK